MSSLEVDTTIQGLDLASQHEEPSVNADTDADGEPRPHSALMNDLVLENVFRKLDKAEDIYVCKQVRMKWSNVIEKIQQEILYSKVLASIVVAKGAGFANEEHRQVALTMRQVSKQWKKDTDLAIANFFDLKIEWNGKSDMWLIHELIGYKPISLDNGNIDKFLMDMELSIENPFVGRELRVLWTAGMESSLIKFLKKFGTHFFTCILRGDNFQTFPDYLLIREMLANLPNLQRLNLQLECAACCAQGFYKKQLNDEAFNRLLVQYPLRKLPNLRAYFGFLDWGIDARLVKTIIDMHKQQMNSVESRVWNFPITVPTFDLNTEFPKLMELNQDTEGFSKDPASAECLRRCNLPLSQMRLTLKDPSQLQDLKNIGSNLKKLSISFVGGDKKNGRGRSRKPIIDENIGKYFPRLKSLTLEFEKGSYIGPFNKYQKRFTSNFVNSFPSIQELKLHDGGIGFGCYLLVRLK